MLKPKKHYTPSEVAKRKMIPLTARSIRRLVESGEIRAENVRSGKQARWIISHSEIERFKKKFKKK